MNRSRHRFLAGTAAVAAASVRVPASAATFEFKCASNLTIDHPASVRLTQMWAAIEKESGGRLRTRFFPNSILGSPEAMFSQLRLGAIQFLHMGPADLVALVPVANISILGFAFKDVDEAFRTMDGPLGTYVRDQVGAKGLYAFRTMWDSGMYELSSSTHPIRTVDDLRGFKVRVNASKIAFDLFKELGASPAPLAFNEIYTSLQTKVVDGVALPLSTIETSRFFEVQKYITITNHSWSGLWLVANGDAWKSLPPDLQEIVERNERKFSVIERRDSKAFNASVEDKLSRQGLAINRVDTEQFRAHLRPYFAFWASAFGPTAWGLLESSLGRKLV